MCYVHAYTQPCHQTTKDQHQTIPYRETCRQTGIPCMPLLIKPKLGVGWIKLRMGPGQLRGFEFPDFYRFSLMWIRLVACLGQWISNLPRSIQGQRFTMEFGQLTIHLTYIYIYAYIRLYIYIHIDWLLVLLSKDKLGSIWFSRERAVLLSFMNLPSSWFILAEDASLGGFAAHWQSISWLCAPGAALDRKSYWFLNDEYDVFVTEVKVHYCVTEIHHFADAPILSFCLCTVYCILVLTPFQQCISIHWHMIILE